MRNSEVILDKLLNGEITDLYQQNPSDWEFLTQFIPGLVITSAGGVIPFQAEGTLHGFPFYFRARGERASLKLSEPGTKPYGSDVLYSAEEDAPFYFTGEEFCQYMLKLTPKLEKAPFCWEFEGYKIDFGDDKTWETISQSDERTTYFGWGNTAEEGWAKTQEVSEYLLENGATLEIQEKMREIKDISRTPLNSDDRVFPETPPFFEVVLPAEVK